MPKDISIKTISIAPLAATAGLLTGGAIAKPPADSVFFNFVYHIAPVCILGSAVAWAG